MTSREAEGRRRLIDAESIATRRAWAGSPALELNVRDDRLQSRAGRREVEAAFAMPLWLPGQRGARAGAAEAAAAQALAAEQAARLRLAGELREAAGSLAALRAELEQAESQAQQLRQLADDVERRVRAGDLARADSLAANAEHLAALAAQADIRQRLQVARAHWTLLTGLSTWPGEHRAAGLAGTSSAAPAGTASAGDAGLGAEVDSHPEMQHANRSVELARQRVELMRRSRSDAPELSVGVRQEFEGRGSASRGSLAVGIRLPLGTDDRNQPLEASALAELEVAQTHEQRLRERLASDIAAARGAQRSAQLHLDAETARAQLLRERATLIDKSFHAGETPLPDLLRALAAAAQADSAVARQTAALGLARARLHQALGLLP